MKPNSHIALFLILHVGLQYASAQPKADTTALRRHVVCLSSIEPSRSIRHISSLDSASRYVESQLRLSSSRVLTQDYFVSQGSVRNIIASFGPESGPRIIVGAHYDVAGDQPGADDNASGIAGLIELARLLAQDTVKLETRIDLVAYTLEEPPYFRTKEMGSFIHARSLHEQDVEVVVMLSLEMIGYFTENENSQRYPIGLMKVFYPEKGDFIAVISNFNSHFMAGNLVAQMEKGCQVPIERLTAPTCVTGVDFSDHLNYWHFGYKGLMITDTSFLRNDNYHETTDSPETLDYSRMAEVVNGVHYAVVHLSP